MNRKELSITGLLLSPVLIAYIFVSLILLGLALRFNIYSEYAFHGFYFHDLWSDHGEFLLSLATSPAQRAGQYFHFAQKGQYCLMAVWQILIYGVTGVILALLFRKQLYPVQQSILHPSCQPLRSHIKQIFTDPFNLLAVAATALVLFYGGVLCIVINAIPYFIVGKCVSLIIRSIIDLVRSQKVKLFFKMQSFFVDWIALGFACIGAIQAILFLYWHVVNPFVGPYNPVVEAAILAFSFQVVLYWLIVRINHIITCYVFARQPNGFALGTEDWQHASCQKRRDVMNSERAQWEDVKNNYLQLIQQSLGSLNHPRRFEILGNVEEHLESKYAELPKEKRTWESYQQIITEMGPPAEYAALLCDDIRHAHRSRVNWFLLTSGVIIAGLLIATAYLVIVSQATGKLRQSSPETSIPVKQTEVQDVKTPPVISDSNATTLPAQPVEPNAYIISFRAKSLAGFTTYRELLDAFNQNHPRGVRTHRYRTQVQDNQLIGYICTDNQVGVKAISDMLAKSDTLELLDVKAATDAEFEAHCQLRQVDLPTNTPGPGQEKFVGIWVVDSNQMDIEQNRIIEQAKRENAGNPEAMAQIEELNNHLRESRWMMPERMGLQFEPDGSGFFYPIPSRIPAEIPSHPEISPRSYMFKPLMPVFLWGSQAENMIRVEPYDRNGSNDQRDRFDLTIEGDRLIRKFPKSNGATILTKYDFEKCYYMRITPDNPLAKKPALLDPKCVKFTPPDGFEGGDAPGLCGIPAQGKTYNNDQRPNEGIKILFTMTAFDANQGSLSPKELLTRIIEAKEQESGKQAKNVVVSKDIQSLDGWPAGVIQYEVQPDKDKLCLKEYYLVDSGAMLMTIDIYAPSVQRLDELDAYVKKIKLNMSDGWAMSREEILQTRKAHNDYLNQIKLDNQRSLQQLQQDKPSTQYPVEEKPSILGKWIAVDYVPKTDDFVPDQRQYKKPMVLKMLEFVEPATVYWSFNNNVLKQTSFGDSAIETINGYSARYTIKTLEGQDYLFVDWMTVDVVKGKQPAWRYVLKREKMDLAAEASGQQSDVDESGVVNNPNVLGKWVSVDFVKTMEDFDPGQRTWGGSLYLTGLEFQTNKHVWFSFNNNSRFQHSWVPGRVESGESRPAFYTVKNIDGNLYMFFEWISGDVTIRGQKPCYYVLKQTTSPQRVVGKTANRKVVIGANYCTMDFIQSKFGQATKREEKMLRYPAKGVDFGFFNSQLLLSEVHLNQGYQGQLKTGISLTSTTDDVFRAYGSPLRILQADDLHGIREDRILYQKGDMSRIYYGQHGLIFWFRDDKVIQIVIFSGEAEIEF